MTENKKTQDIEEKAEKAASKPKTSTVDAATKEPTQERVDPAASAEPAVVPATPNAAVSGTAVDSIVYSSAKPTPRTGPRKSLTVYHLARRLYEHGHTEAWSETVYGPLTRSSVAAWQADRADEPTGVLTREQFTALFAGDENVDALVDTIDDHPVD